MLSELNNIFSNIKKFRHLLNEGVGDDPIIKAINNREYVYLYYEGDDTIEKGYRSVRCYVLGTSKAGNKVVRAWQDRGKSDSLRPDSPRQRIYHEYHIDNDGKTKPGWRLFRLDRISYFYPTGKRFMDKEGNIMIPPLYNQKDKGMISIVTSITPPTTKNVVDTDNLDNIVKPNIIKQKLKKSEFDTQTSRFKQFYNVGKHVRDITVNDVNDLYNVVKKVMKKSPNNYMVLIDNNGDFHLSPIANKKNVPKEAIVGDLSALHSRLVVGDKNIRPEEQNFINKIKNDLRKK